MPGTDELRGSDLKLGPTGRIRSLCQSGVQHIARYDHSEAYEHRGETVPPPRGQDSESGWVLAGKNGIGQLETGR
jgi:hypothetical protein